MHQSSYPISHLRQYLFCPRIPYYIEISNVIPKQNLWCRQGSELNLKFALKSSARILKKFQLEHGDVKLELNVQSLYHKIHGRIDAMIITDEEVVPIEIKSSRQLNDSAAIQLCAYAICLEEMYFKKIQIGFLVEGQNLKIRTIEINKSLREKTITTLTKMDEIINQGVLPLSSVKIEKCLQCEYLKYCNDRI